MKKDHFSVKEPLREGSGVVLPAGRYRPGDPDYLEHLDPTPVEIPTRLKLPQRQVDRVRELVRREMSAQAAAEGMETFEEADDFDLEDEEWASPYEELFEPAGAPGEPVEPKAAPPSAGGALDKKQVGAQGAADAKRQPDGVVASAPDPRDG